MVFILLSESINLRYILQEGLIRAKTVLQEGLTRAKTVSSGASQVFFIWAVIRMRNALRRAYYPFKRC